jgi:hypothetical protein
MDPQSSGRRWVMISRSYAVRVDAVRRTLCRFASVGLAAIGASLLLTTTSSAEGAEPLTRQSINTQRMAAIEKFQTRGYHSSVGGWR